MLVVLWSLVAAAAAKPERVTFDGFAAHNQT
jgi:hypothetical protein